MSDIHHNTDIPFLSLKEVTELHGAEINDAVQRVVSSGWYLLGNETKAFEESYSRFIGTKHTICCANGLDALWLIFRAYIELGRLHSGDEVIVPANTYIATVLSITENGLTPVFCEPRLETLEIDDNAIEQLITPRTKALAIVHLYGRNAYTQKIGDICKRHNLLLVEDCAQSHGCHAADGRVTGNIGNAGAHSFYPGKNLGALGDGGAVTTNDDALATAIRAIANYGSAQKYVFRYCGRNSRLDELQAAILSVKLRHLADDNSHRKTIAGRYYQHISNPAISLPKLMPDDENVYHLFPILCRQRDKLQQYLSEKGIQTLIHYPIPPHKQQCYTQYSALSLPITEEIANTELSLPIGPTISEQEADYIINTLNSFHPTL